MPAAFSPFPVPHEKTLGKSAFEAMRRRLSHGHTAALHDKQPKRQQQHKRHWTITSSARHAAEARKRPSSAASEGDLVQHTSTKPWAGLGPRQRTLSSPAESLGPCLAELEQISPPACSGTQGQLADAGAAAAAAASTAAPLSSSPLSSACDEVDAHVELELDFAQSLLGMMGLAIKMEVDEVMMVEETTLTQSSSDDEYLRRRPTSRQQPPPHADHLNLNVSTPTQDVSFTSSACPALTHSTDSELSSRRSMGSIGSHAHHYTPFYLADELLLLPPRLLQQAHESTTPTPTSASVVTIKKLEEAGVEAAFGPPPFLIPVPTQYQHRVAMSSDGGGSGDATEAMSASTHAHDTHNTTPPRRHRRQAGAVSPAKLQQQEARQRKQQFRVSKAPTLSLGQQARRHCDSSEDEDLRLSSSSPPPSRLLLLQDGLLTSASSRRLRLRSASCSDAQLFAPPISSSSSDMSPSADEASYNNGDAARASVRPKVIRTSSSSNSIKASHSAAASTTASRVRSHSTPRSEAAPTAWPVVFAAPASHLASLPLPVRLGLIDAQHFERVQRGSADDTPHSSPRLGPTRTPSGQYVASNGAAGYYLMRPPPGVRERSARSSNGSSSETRSLYGLTFSDLAAESTSTLTTSPPSSPLTFSTKRLTRVQSNEPHQRASGRRAVGPSFSGSSLRRTLSARSQEPRLALRSGERSLGLHDELGEAMGCSDTEPWKVEDYFVRKPRTSKGRLRTTVYQAVEPGETPYRWSYDTDALTA